eukprot:1182592-Prorocentrum_minimum.AAC.1
MECAWGEKSENPESDLCKPTWELTVAHNSELNALKQIEQIVKAKLSIHAHVVGTSSHNSPRVLPPANLPPLANLPPAVLPPAVCCSSSSARRNPSKGFSCWGSFAVCP